MHLLGPAGDQEELSGGALAYDLAWHAIRRAQPIIPFLGASSLHLLATHFAHVHEMSFRIKCLCAVKVHTSSAVVTP
jgi:hypothetical protein